MACDRFDARKLNDDETDDKEERLRKMLEQARNAEASDPVQAEADYQKALETAEALFGAESKPMATALYYLAKFYGSRNQMVRARECYTRLMKIMRW